MTKSPENLLVLGYYGNADGYKAAIDNFKHYFNKVHFFPLMHYLHNSKELIISDLEKIIIREEIKYLIIWHNIGTIKGMSTTLQELQKLIYNKNVKMINVNWDPDPQFYNEKDYQK